MATDLNHVTIIGRLTRDPDLRYTQSGTAVCSFSIANNKTYVTGGEKKEQVSYFNCVAWSKLGETITEYCKKGNRIGIEGRLQQRSWEDNNGNKRSAVEIVVESIQFLEAKKAVENNRPAAAASQQPDPEPALAFSETTNPFSDEDIPF
jgi:single-strand DNA-binding protein